VFGKQHQHDLLTVRAVAGIARLEGPAFNVEQRVGDGFGQAGDDTGALSLDIVSLNAGLRQP